jgi:GWxTD domain-containing protein
MMTLFAGWLQTPWATAWAKTLLHSLWEGAAVALVLALVLVEARSARVRYGAACLAMLVLLAGMVVTFSRLVPGRPVLAGAAHGGHIPLATRHFETATEPRPSPATGDLAWLVPVWLAGVLAFHLRGVAGWVAARRLRRTGVCVAAEPWQQRLDGLRTQLWIARPVALLESCLADVPVVIGYVRPVILMPVGLLAGLPVGQVEAILLHELAHIRRYDYIVNLLQVFVEGLLFYHPAVWWISGVMRTERENCCDDVVVRVTGGALEYAAALTALEIRRTDTRVVLAATGGGLVNRIQRLLWQREQPYPSAMPVLTALIVTIALASIALATATVALPVGTFEHAEKALAGAKPPAEHIGAFAGANAEEIFPLMAQVQARTQSQSQPGSALQPDQVMFDRAMASLAQGHYLVARLTLNTLINSYSNSEYLKKAKLAIADSWFREGGAHGKAQAEAEYRDFILFYPDSDEAKEARLRLETISPYEKWLNQDVVYIISGEERKGFRQLTSDEERDRFVVQFWERRNPVPGSAENEFKIEHYRRLAYANEHFSSGMPGWRTDRGRIYIQYGPPDQMEAHPAASSPRPAGEGGGATSTFPWQQWLYRYIEGVGRNVILEFVDKTANGDYRLTMDPSEKDALTAQPGAQPAAARQ